MISPFIMIAIGVVLCITEFIFFSFYLLFFGIAFIVVGAINFGFSFAWSYFNEEFLDEAGVGEIRENMVYFKGTLWKYDGNLANGEKVTVLGTKGDKVILK